MGALDSCSRRLSPCSLLRAFTSLRLALCSATLPFTPLRRSLPRLPFSPRWRPRSLLGTALLRPLPLPLVLVV